VRGGAASVRTELLHAANEGLTHAPSPFARSCLPAPGPAAAADWVLVGDKSVKSGASRVSQPVHQAALATAPPQGARATHSVLPPGAHT
jgi:hypothetical protein